MGSYRIALALVAAQMIAGSLHAQTAGEWVESTPAEYRASGGEIDVRGKHATNRFSGSLGLVTSPGLGGQGATRGLEATLGGALIEDRLWFFGSAQWRDQSLSSRFAPSLPQANSEAQAFDAKLTANLGDRQNLAAAFSTGHDTLSSFTTVQRPATNLFLSYTGIVSDNMFFTATASRRTYSRSPFALQPLAPGQ
jgi:hypothetical protein